MSTTEIPGGYHTVHSLAVRSAVDVYTENARTVSLLKLEAGLRICMICIGSLLVGSVVHTVFPGQAVKRMDDMGYFKFGGSTVILLFPRGAVQLDADLLNS